MRSSLLVIALLLVAGCASSSGPAATPPPVANVSAALAKLRIARVAPRVGMVRFETSVTRGDDRETRKVTRIEILAVEGLIATKRRIMYLEASGEDAPLAGKAFELSVTNGQVEVVPIDGTPPGNEELVRRDYQSASRPDTTMMMVSNRDFVIDTPVRVPPPAVMPPETNVTLTLRSFEQDTATFDIAIQLTTDSMGLRAKGRMVVDRATGLDHLAEMTMEYRFGDRTEHSSLEFEAKIE